MVRSTILSSQSRQQLMGDDAEGNAKFESGKESSDGLAFFIDLLAYLANKVVSDSFENEIPQDVRLAAGKVQSQLVLAQKEIDALVNTIRTYNPGFLADKFDAPTLADFLEAGFGGVEDE